MSLAFQIQKQMIGQENTGAMDTHFQSHISHILFATDSPFFVA